MIIFEGTAAVTLRELKEEVGKVEGASGGESHFSKKIRSNITNMIVFQDT